VISSTAQDRRHRRRQETIEEVLDVAVAIMAEHGVAGLSIGEIARRLGIRPPSLYVYFPSKHALYDALFERGARSVLAALSPLQEPPPDGLSLEEYLRRSGAAFIRWSVENPAYSQLLFWRPVPGFTPSPAAYAPATQLVERNQACIAALQRRGAVRSDVDAATVHRDWTILVSGVVSQQLANAPSESFEEGRFTRALDSLVAMFVRHYARPAAHGGTDRAHDR